MDPYADDPRLPGSARCPSCRALAYAGTGGWSTCTTCGHSWPVHPAEIPASDPLDILSTVTLTIDRLRRYLTAPDSPDETLAAARRLRDLTTRPDPS
jgi:hypothetical protein